MSIDKSLLKTLFLGFLLGTMITIDGGSLVIAFFFFLTIIFLNKKFKDEEEKNFLLIVFLWGFIIRAFICVAAHAYNEVSGNVYHYMIYTGNCIFGDGAFESVKAKGLADIWQRKIDPAIFLPFIKEVRSLHFYIYSIFYYLFGQHDLSVKFINILYGTTGAIMIYLIAKELFGKKTAKISYMFTMFFPSLILWSVSNLKETVQILIFSIWIYSLIMIGKGIRRRKYLLLAAISALFTMYIRDRMVVLLLAGAAASFFCLLDMRLKKILIAVTLFLAAIFLTYSFFSGFDIILMLRLKVASFMKTAISWQAGVYLANGYNYMIYPPQFYTHELSHISVYMFGPIEVLHYIVKSVFFFLTMPLPWMIVSLKQVIVYPQLLLWYVLLLFSLIGVTRAFIEGNRLSYIPLMFILALMIPMALVSSNMGTAFRHRDIFTPFIIIFASYGIIWFNTRTRTGYK